MIASVLAGSSLVIQAYSTFSSAAQSKQAAEKQAKKAQQKKKKTQPDSGKIVGRPVLPFVRVFWLVGFFMMLGLGLFLLIWAGTELHGADYTAGVALGVDSLILSLFCLIGVFRGRFNGWYRYIIKPGILLICVLTVVFSSIFMSRVRVHDEEFLVLLMLIIFPAIAFLVVAILPATLFVSSVSKPARLPAAPSKQPAISSSKAPAGVSSFKRLWALILSAGSFLGICGLQRFYVGKIGTGILWFLTAGLFGIGQLIDVIMIIVGNFKDRYGLPLVIWHDSEELKVKTPNTQAADKVQAPGLDVAAAEDRPAETVQAPVVEDSPARFAPSAPTTTVIYEPFHPLAFLFSGIGFILVFVAIVVGLAVGLHTPYLVAAGVPDLAEELDQAFGYSQWPDLFMRLGMIVTAALLLFAAVFVIIGRRYSGARHLIRGVLGLGGLLAAVMWLSDGISWGFRGNDEVLASQQIGPVLEMLLEGCQSEEVLFAGVFFLVSVVVLAWPARRKQIMYNPALNQGVS